ncbi:MAG: hypothetical protein K2Y01_11285 [Rhabdochlamydiaceae bacterium]|nr:hypothetical protein [Rhabdochlamydiaceae bacterium]
MLKLPDNLRSTVIPQVSKRERDVESPFFTQNKKIKRAFDANRYWTSAESNALKQVMAECFSDKPFKWSVVRDILASQGVFKNNKQIRHRWSILDSPSIIPRIDACHEIKLLCLISCYLGDWSGLSKFIKEHNSGFTYSGNSIKNLYYKVKRSQGGLVRQEEQEKIWEQYPGLSKVQAAIEIAKSLKLDEYKKQFDASDALDVFFQEDFDDSSDRPIVNRKIPQVECSSNVVGNIFPFFSVASSRLAGVTPPGQSDVLSSQEDEFAEERRCSVVSDSSEKQAVQERIEEAGKSDLAQLVNQSSKVFFGGPSGEKVEAPVLQDSSEYSKGRWTFKDKMIFWDIIREFKSEFLKEDIDWDKIAVIANLRGVNKSSSQISKHWEICESPFIIQSIDDERKIKVACIIDHLDGTWEKRSRFIKAHNGGYHYTATKMRDFTRVVNYSEILNESKKIWDEYVERFGFEALEEIAKSLHLDKINHHEEALKSFLPYPVINPNPIRANSTVQYHALAGDMNPLQLYKIDAILAEGYIWDPLQESRAGALDTSSEKLDSDLDPLELCGIDVELVKGNHPLEEMHTGIIDLK